MSTHPHPPLSRSSNQYWNSLESAADYVRSHLGVAQYAIVLGSGLMDFTKELKNAKSIHYADIPFMPGTTVSGHTGDLFHGELPTAAGSSPVLCFAGRVHTYEGWRAAEVNFIVRLSHRLGVKVMILTNSAGGALKGMTPGSIMMIEDHVRFCSVNPLLDVCEDVRFGSRHLLPGKRCYSERLINLTTEVAKSLNMPVLKGVYSWWSGPSYETPAEIQAGIRITNDELGGSFGMSTVPEVLAASSLGMEVFAMSLCTNMAAGLSKEKLTHEGVKDVANEAGPRFQRLLVNIFSKLSVDPERAKLIQAPHPPLNFNALTQTPNHSLQPVGAWQPSVHEIAQGIELVKQNTDRASNFKSLLFLYGAGSHFALPSLITNTFTRSRVLNLANFTMVQQSSNTSRTGSLVLGETKSGSRVAIISGEHIEGLTSSETSFFVQVFYGLGISNVFTHFLSSTVSSEASSLTPSNSASSVLLLNDIVDRTIDPLPLPVIQHTLPIQPHNNDQPLFDQGLREIASKSLKDSNQASSVGSYIAFAGPMFPTNTELNMAMKGKCSGVGITNISAVQCAAALGLKVFASSQLVPTLNSLLTPPNDATLTNVGRMLSSLLDVGASRELHPIDVEAVIHRHPNLKQLLAGYGPVCNVPQQESFNAITAAVHFLQTHLATLPSPPISAVFIEGMLKDCGSDIKIIGTIPCVTIPHFAEYAGIHAKPGDVSGSFYPYSPTLLNDWSISYGDLNGTSVLVVTTDRDYTGVVPAFHGLTFLVRMLKVLNINNVTFITPVASVDDQHAVGDLVLFKDQINFTGLNPLFGENVHQWGPRFCDMSHVYPPLAINALKQGPHGASLNTSIIAQVPSPTLSSSSESLLCHSMTASTIVSGLIPLSIVAKHMDLCVVGIGYVYRRAGNNHNNSNEALLPSVHKPTQHKLQLLRDILDDGVPKLHVFCKSHLEMEK